MGAGLGGRGRVHAGVRVMGTGRGKGKQVLGLTVQLHRMARRRGSAMRSGKESSRDMQS